MARNDAHTVRKAGNDPYGIEQIELSQDLRACGYTAETNPELAEILNVRPPVTTTS